MSRLASLKLRLPSYFYVTAAPPNETGDETLSFVSERRRIKLKGHSFREFHRAVIPLLDGTRTVAEIHQEVADLFTAEDLNAGLELLLEHEILETSDAGDGAAAELEPQLNFFREVSPEGAAAQRHLEHAKVVVIGLGGPGSYAVQALASIGVGRIVCVDALAVANTDVYLSSLFMPGDVARNRAEVLASRVSVQAPRSRVEAVQSAPAGDEDVERLLAGADFAVCAADSAQATLFYRLNRVSLKTGLRWIACRSSALELVIGPSIFPSETACYMCYRMRSVACASEPSDELAFQRFLDNRKQDDAGRRENLSIAAALTGQLLALEILKHLTGVGSVTTKGRILVFDPLEMTFEKHLVLRKPWCPACKAPV